MRNNRQMTYDFLIEKKLDIYPLISQEDKIICMDINPESQQIIMLLKRKQQHELVLCDASFNLSKRTSITPPIDHRDFLFRTIRFLPNGLIFVFGEFSGHASYTFFDSSLNRSWEQNLGRIDNHLFIFNHDSVHALIRNFPVFKLIKIENGQNVLTVENPGHNFEISTFLKKSNKDNNIEFYGMHALADNTIAVCSHHNGSLFLSFCKINNDKLVVNSVVEVDKIGHDCERYSYLPSISEGELILRITPADGFGSRAYFLKKLENTWEILPEFFSFDSDAGFNYAFDSAPFFIEGDKKYNACRLVDLKTKTAFTIPKTCEFLPARDDKLYILNQGKAFLAFFADKKLQNTFASVLKSFFPDALVELVASYVNLNFFSYRASDSSTHADSTQTNVLEKKANP